MYLLRVPTHIDRNNSNIRNNFDNVDYITGIHIKPVLFPRKRFYWNNEPTKLLYLLSQKEDMSVSFYYYSQLQRHLIHFRPWDAFRENVCQCLLETSQQLVGLWVNIVAIYVYLGPQRQYSTFLFSFMIR